VDVGFGSSTSAELKPGSTDTCRAMFLGGFGARVIKVDPPGPVVPLPNMDIGGEKFAAYHAPNRNKTSVVLA
jgi:crotonobetainyl-CoA:carnitine CoA-transferase CaiB-like acyl-CoA transferase